MVPGRPPRPAAGLVGTQRPSPWQVSVNDAATKKVADFTSGALVKPPDSSTETMSTRRIQGSKRGTLLAWPSAVWGPGVLTCNAAATKGQVGSWQRLPQWNAGVQQDGQLGGSSPHLRQVKTSPSRTVRPPG